MYSLVHKNRQRCEEAATQFGCFILGKHRMYIYLFWASRLNSSHVGPPEEFKGWDLEECKEEHTVHAANLRNVSEIQTAPAMDPPTSHSWLLQ